MVALDDLTGNVQRLDSVRIDSALCQPLGIGNLLSLSIEHLDKIATDNLTLLLRVGNASQVAKELLAGINANHVQPQTTVVVHHLLELVLAQHTVIDEDTRQVLTNGTIQQHGSNRTVNTTRETQDDAILTQLLFQLSNGAIDKRSSTPLLLTATDIDHEILQQGLTLKGVIYFRMELNSPKGSLTPALSEWRARPIGSLLHIVRRSNGFKTVGNGRNGVAMRHPYLRVLLKALEERIRSIYRLKVGTTILARVGLFHLTT